MKTKTYDDYVCGNPNYSFARTGYERGRADYSSRRFSGAIQSTERGWWAPRREEPFIFLIPATGEGPLVYSAENLPLSLKLDPKTGIITGSLLYGGEYDVMLTVTGPKGTAKRKLTIIAGTTSWRRPRPWAGTPGTSGACP